MKKVAIYIRVSSEKQAQEGDSIPAQRTALMSYIDNHDDMILAGEYLDDGASGTKDNRDELQRMLSDVRDGKIDLIIVTKMDRLHRSLRNFLNMQDLLEKHHCHWLAINEPIYDTSTPQGKMIINTMMNLAQFEAEQTGQRIRQVQEYKVSKGEVISGSTPPGYKIVNKHLVPDENADIVRQAFEHYSYCGNMDMTMRAFDHYHIFPQTKSAWKIILTNSKYIGIFRDNDHFCDPIIDRELFEDVQRKVLMNVKVSQKHTYVFSGLIRCGECGRVMAGVFRKNKRGKVINMKSYRCPAHYGSIQRCTNGKVIEEHRLEQILLERVRSDLQGIVYHATTSDAPAKDNSTRISALNKRCDRLKELFLNDLMSLDEYKLEREKIQEEIKALSQTETIVNTEPIKAFLSQPFEQFYQSLSDEERRYLWRSIIKEIRFSIDRVIDPVYLS